MQEGLKPLLSLISVGSDHIGFRIGFRNKKKDRHYWLSASCENQFPSKKLLDSIDSRSAKKGSVFLYNFIRIL